MMKIKGQLPRWVFKNVSLMLADTEANRNTVEIRASEIGNSSGSNWQRSRQMLGEVTKAIQKLKDLDVIEAFVATPVMSGKKKDDVVFSVQFSATFMADRRAARGEGRVQPQSGTQACRHGEAGHVSSHRVRSCNADQSCRKQGASTLGRLTYRRR